MTKTAKQNLTAIDKEKLSPFLSGEKKKFSRWVSLFSVENPMDLYARRTQHLINAKVGIVEVFDIANVSVSYPGNGLFRTLLDYIEPLANVRVESCSKRLSEFLTERGYVPVLNDGNTFYRPRG